MEKKRILIIEDENDFALAVSATLKQTGRYDMSIANDGKEGLDKARQHSPDLVILDLNLPKLPGEEVCRELKRDKNTRDISILMVTAKNSDTQRVVGRVIGADHYIVKPVGADELLKAVDELTR